MNTAAQPAISPCSAPNASPDARAYPQAARRRRPGQGLYRQSSRMGWFRHQIQEGFTLLELLVVLALMGFLIAMVAPRLAGITGEGLGTVTRTNMTRLVSLLTAELQRTGTYPTGMVNIVTVEGGTNTYHKPMLSDQDPETGPEVLSYKMDRRHRFFLHQLSTEEAAELRSLGVFHVYNYNSPYDRNVIPGSPNMEPVTAGVAVLMTGGGASTNPGPITADLAEADRAHPAELFRMVFGLGTETSLVTRGVVHGPSTCPESGLAPINYEWKWYSLLLPRLKATAARLVADDPLGLGMNGPVTAYAATGSHPAAALTGATRRTVETYAPQHRAFFAVMDSEGEVLPTVDMKGWGLDLNANGDID